MIASSIAMERLLLSAYDTAEATKVLVEIVGAEECKSGTGAGSISSSGTTVTASVTKMVEYFRIKKVKYYKMTIIFQT